MNTEEKSFRYQTLQIFLHPEVYEPAEDTFLLLDSIEIQAKQDIFEIGAGTGIISLACAKKGAHVICSDINPYAIHIIKKNIRENRDKITGSIQVRKGELFTVLSKNEQFDVIIFNPPYLPTTKEQLIGGSGWYDRALDGGPTGLTVTTAFLKDVTAYLKNDGAAYFIYSSLSKRTQLEKTSSLLEIKVETIRSLTCGDETLQVMKL